MSNGAFVDLIQRNFPPVVAVLTSDDVDAICANNNLSFADMLMPFATLTNSGSFFFKKKIEFRTNQIFVLSMIYLQLLLMCFFFQLP